MADEHRVADPGPLGLAGFAMTTFCLSSANANIWHAGGAAAALALALVYGGIAQFAAGMWEFHRKNTFGALAFTSYGAFWISFYVLLKIPAITAGTDTVAIFLLGWTIFTAYMTIAALKTSAAVLSVFVALTVTFFLLTVGNWGDTARTGWIHWGGYIGLVTAALAWYASAAGVINDTHGKVVLPVGPLS
ncbi:MAG: acetate uptake transporter [Acidobacteriota bacterium]|nr:acetate uptake transporter [Acidobacteriota bacterium]